MLNPDGVANGSYRCSMAGCDLNRWVYGCSMAGRDGRTAWRDVMDVQHGGVCGGPGGDTKGLEMRRV